jgi:amidohydrolase family protein
MGRIKALAGIVVTIGVAALAAPAMSQTAPPRPEKIAIVGATLIDVSGYGRSTNDISNAVVVIDGGKIIAVGPASTVAIPPDAKRIDAAGTYLVPGLIDGFGAMRTQGFANAYLYEGVTTVYVATGLATGGGDHESKILRDAAPSPRLFLGAPMTGYSETGADPSDKPMTEHRLHDVRLANAQLVARVDRLADQGFRGITISYDVWPDQVDTIVNEANRRGLATIGELQFTSYPYAVRAGVGALLRNDQYLTELAPSTAKLARADSLPAGAAAVRALCTIDPASSGVKDYGEQLAHAHTALMPTLSMEATADLLDIPSPWTAKSSALIKATDLDIPVDPVTGASGFLQSLPADRRWHVRECAFHKELLDGQLYAAGAKFLAGSNATTYGIMPGSGLHLELVLLHRIGLSPREALAAATSNYADVYGWAEVGRIEPGRVADLLLLDADPRTDVSAVDHIHSLVFQGAVVDRDALLGMSKTK